MAIAFRAATSGGYTAVNDLTITAPAGLADGDLILVFVTSISAHEIANVPDGWEQVGSRQDDGTDSSNSLFRKIASSEGANWTFTDIYSATETGVWACVAYSGVDNTTPLDVAVVQGAVGGTVTAGDPHTAGPITPTSNGAMIVAVYGVDALAAINGTPDDNPAATERVDHDGGDPYSFAFIQDYSQATAAEVSLDMILNVNDTSAWFIVALRPAAAGGATAVPKIMMYYRRLRG